MISRLEKARFMGDRFSAAGAGWIGGSVPPDPNPNSPDGRTRVMGEPVQMDVLLLDGKTRRAIDQVRSNPDGTWKFIGLKPNHHFAVEFVNQNGVYSDINGQPYNSFIQDFIFAVPPEYMNMNPLWAHNGELLDIHLTTGYQYFRIVISSTYYDSVATIAELELRNIDGEKFVPTIIAASSEYPGGTLGPGNAFDENIETSWASNYTSQLPAILNFSSDVMFYPASLSLTAGRDPVWGPRQALRDFVLQGSHDEVLWENLLTVTNQPAWVESETRTWTL